jgi:predicted O-methyltransferase YrrM
MHHDVFLERLPTLFDDYPRSEQPRDARFEAVVERVGGLARANNLALLNLAVSLLGPGERYLEVGTFKGASLVGALIDNEARAFAVDSFTFRDGTRGGLERTLREFGLDEQVSILEGDAFDLIGSGVLADAQVGVFYWDADHDREAVAAGLALVEPWLVPGALLVVDDSDWERVASGVDDYLAAEPRARRVLTIDGATHGAPHWWEGMQVLSFGSPGKSG